MPGAAVDAIGGRAAQNLIDQLRVLDLGRRAKNRRMAMISMAYGEAGAILRVAQTSRIPDEMIERPDRLCKSAGRTPGDTRTIARR